MELSPVVFWYAAALLAGIYFPAGHPGLFAPVLFACALAASAFGMRRTGRLALCAAFYAGGCALEGEGAGAGPALSDVRVFECVVRTVTPTDVWVSSEGARFRLSGGGLADAVMEGDSALVLVEKRGGSLQCCCFHLRPSRRLLDLARRAAAGILRERIPSRQASSLACAMLLGERSRMPASVRAVFREAGISHMLAVSGLHVALVSGAVFLALRRVAGRTWWSVSGTLLVMWLYVLLSGGRVPAFRAGMMGSIAIMASQAGFRVPAISSWSLAVIAVAIAIPGAAADAGAQMSFASVLALVLMSGRSRSLRGHVLAALHAGLCSTLAVAPLVQSSYGALRLSSPYATLVSTPLMYLVIVLGALCLVPAACVPASRLLEWSAWSWLAIAEASRLPPVRFSGPAAWCAWASALAALWFAGRRRGFLSRFGSPRSLREPRVPGE